MQKFCIGIISPNAMLGLWDCKTTAIRSQNLALRQLFKQVLSESVVSVAWATPSTPDERKQSPQ